MHLNASKNIRIFKSDFWENLTYINPLVPITFWSAVIISCLAYATIYDRLNFFQIVSIMFAGLAVWTLAEYILHRFIFHFHPKSDWLKRQVYIFHGVHHEDPNDERRILMPLTPGILIYSMFHLLFIKTIGPVYANPFGAGFLIGYLCYDYIHFATHYLKQPRGVMGILKKYHMRHHFIHPDKAYGVSSGFWDIIFRTRP